MKTPGVASVFSEWLLTRLALGAGVCLGPGRYIWASEVRSQMQFKTSEAIVSLM